MIGGTFPAKCGNKKSKKDEDCREKKTKKKNKGKKVRRITGSRGGEESTASALLKLVQKSEKVLGTETKGKNSISKSCLEEGEKEEVKGGLTESPLF